MKSQKDAKILIAFGTYIIIKGVGFMDLFWTIVVILDLLVIGIYTPFSWWLNPYIAGRCYYSDIDPNNPGTQTFIAILDRTE